MSWTPQQKIRAGFWLLSVVPLLLGVLTFLNAGSLVRAAGDVERTNRLEKRLERSLSALKDIELAQRGFLLTGDEFYVAELADLRSRLQKDIAAFSGETRDSHWLELLNTNLSQKLDEINESFEVRRRDGLEAAAALVAKGAGQQPMDSIRVIFRNLMRLEEDKLATRTRYQRTTFISTMALFSAVLLLNMVLIAAMAYLVRRDTQEIRALNVTLERKVAERTKALERSNEELQQFAYATSHDLKEPLRMISSYATLLQRRYGQQLDREADVFLGFVIDGVKRMEKLIEDLLEYARTGELREQTIEAGQAIQAALDNLRATVAESGARVTLDTMPAVIYDPVSLTQVFQNLIGNAIKYRGDRSPVIHISALTSGDEVTFSINDNGIGIEPQFADQVFGVFKRLHGKEYEGTGIGLAMVKKIVERHGGRIWLNSTPGVGSTFSFTARLASSAGRSQTGVSA